LVALGCSVCYLSSKRWVVGAEKPRAAPEAAIVRAKVGLGPWPDGGFGLTVQLEVSIAGVERAVAEHMAAPVHEISPFFNAARGNLDLEITLV
jgi:osmotically inducible protein OsmC